MNPYNNNSSKKKQNPNKSFYIEEEYEEYVEDNILINIIIKGIIIIIVIELFLFGIGIFTTEEVNNRPTVVTIEDRKENVYIKKINDHLDALQQSSVKIDQIYQLYYQNENRGTREADKELRGYLLENQQIIEDIKYMTSEEVPERFGKAHQAFKQMINVRLETTKNLLNYLRTFSPQYIENYQRSNEIYHREMIGFSNLWNRLISN
jgi:hypothetical protein